MILKRLKSGFSKVKNALGKTRNFFGGRISGLFSGKSSLDESTLEELEEILYEADLGVQTAAELVEALGEAKLSGAEAVPWLRTQLLERLKQAPQPKEVEAPEVTLIVGVNGNGKTTSVAKLAKLYMDEGRKVIVGAADTFRAAAIDQLALWAERVGCEIVKAKPGSDPAAVAYDSVSAAQARKADAVLIDTAGRLHTKTHLMEELAKIRRSCHKVIKGAPHRTLLVLDASTGQNAIDQAKVFHKFTPIDGIILTKIDGTAKGGIVIAIQRELGVPVMYLGVGEGMDDLEPFDPEAFVDAILAQ